MMMIGFETAAYLGECKSKINPLGWITLLIAEALFISCSSPRGESVPVLYSTYVKDSFEIYIDLPNGYSHDSVNAVVLYMDANLKMGNEVRRQIHLDENKINLRNVIFVGVGHIGNYRKLRRRDFIPPRFENNNYLVEADEYFGQAENFYSFLTMELIPYVHQKYSTQHSYSIIGHSLSGLFAFHCITKEDSVFKTYIALSPSLWVNDRNFFDVERSLFLTKKRGFSGSLYHACGTEEWSNKILNSSRQMNDSIRSRKSPLLNYRYQEHKDKGHNDVVPVSLNIVLKEYDFHDQ